MVPEAKDGAFTTQAFLWTVVEHPHTFSLLRWRVFGVVCKLGVVVWGMSIFCHTSKGIFVTLQDFCTRTRQ